MQFIVVPEPVTVAFTISSFVRSTFKTDLFNFLEYLDFIGIYKNAGFSTCIADCLNTVVTKAENTFSIIDFKFYQVSIAPANTAMFALVFFWLSHPKSHNRFTSTSHFPLSQTTYCAIVDIEHQNARAVQAKADCLGDIA